MAKNTKVSSLQHRYSRYIQGGLTVEFPNRLGWWERTTLAESDDDISFTITPRFARRPDLVAAEAYGNSQLMWLVLQYNKIQDINTEFVEGAVIKLPTKSRVFTTIVTKAIGSTLQDE